MSNFTDLVNQMTVETSNNIKSYVHYRPETGEIVKIANRQTVVDGYEVLEVDYSEVKELKLGKRQFSDFFVAFNVTLKRVALNEVVRELRSLDIRQQLYQIPVTNVPADITFVKDINNNILSLSASSSLRLDKVLLHQCARLSLNFSITANNDPNILHEHFSINLQDLLTNDFLDVTALFQHEPELKNISIYTTKFFQTYSIEEI
jgi:hypothetical protein